MRRRNAGLTGKMLQLPTTPLYQFSPQVTFLEADKLTAISFAGSSDTMTCATLCKDVQRELSVQQLTKSTVLKELHSKQYRKFLHNNFRH